MTDGFNPPPTDFNLVIKPHHTRHPLATMDAKLPFVKRTYAAPNCNNALPGSNFDRVQLRKVLLAEIVDHTMFQIVI